MNADERGFIPAKEQPKQFGQVTYRVIRNQERVVFSATSGRCLIFGFWGLMAIASGRLGTGFEQRDESGVFLFMRNERQRPALDKKLSL